MPELSLRDLNPDNVERIVGAHAALDLLVERYLRRRVERSLGEFEVPLRISSAESLQALEDMQVADLVIRPGESIGVIGYAVDSPNVAHEGWDEWLDQDSVLGNMALSHAGVFGIDATPTSISMIGYRRRLKTNGPTSAMLAMSLYYKRGIYDGQQIIGMHTTPEGRAETIRFAHFDYDDKRQYEETVRRPADPLQVAHFTTRARDFLLYAGAHDI